ncbi:hypothetical protein [Phenylobacterium sp.]|uniref:hypothetical protein n=1 Tax=Phenylobacterium sp. TaxID=1871053 RepID=UPI0035613B14
MRRTQIALAGLAIVAGLGLIFANIAAGKLLVIAGGIALALLVAAGRKGRAHQG